MVIDAPYGADGIRDQFRILDVQDLLRSVGAGASPANSLFEVGGPGLENLFDPLSRVGGFSLRAGRYQHRQIEKGVDDSFEIYACAENPGVPNWISTVGYTNGHIVFPTLLAEVPMKAEFSVVKISEIE